MFWYGVVTSVTNSFQACLWWARVGVVAGDDWGAAGTEQLGSGDFWGFSDAGRNARAEFSHQDGIHRAVGFVWRVFRRKAKCIVLLGADGGVGGDHANYFPIQEPDARRGGAVVHHPDAAGVCTVQQPVAVLPD